MKRFITSIFALFLCFATQAQIEQGAIALMGGIHVLNLTSLDDPGGSSPIFYSRNNTTNLDFGGMYAFTNAISGGVALLIQNSASLSGSDKGDLKLNSSQAQSGARIFGRYYYPCFAPRFYTFGQVQFAFLGGATKGYDLDGNEVSKDNLSTVNAGINTGFAYFLIPAIAMEINFGLFNWTQQTTKFQDSEARRVSNSYELLALSKTLTFGFCWYLGRSGGF